MTLHRTVFGRKLAWPLVAAIILAPLPAFAVSEGIPAAAVLELLPATEKITDQYGEIEEDELGNRFSWRMAGKWPHKYPDCYASFYNSELSLEIQGDWSWAVGPLAEQLVDMFNEDLESARASLAEELPSSIYKQGKGKSWEETLPNGSIFVTEFTEECDGRPNSTLTKVQGYAIRPPSTLAVRLTLNDSAAEARAMVVGILDKFEKLDLEALTK